MKTAYIFHDAFGSPLSDWYPWMKTTLEAMDYLVIVPSFPTPGAQSYESWKAVMKNYIPTWNEETIVIGHGTGGLFALRLVEESIKQIGGLFLVATYAEAIGNVGFDRLNKTFYEHVFDWEKIQTHAMTVRIFAGDNDPFVPIAVTQNLSGYLSQNVDIISDGGHLNKAAGFVQIVPVAQGIKESLNALDRSIQVDKPDELSHEVIQKETPSQENKNPQPTEPALDSLPKETELRSHTMMQDLSHLVSSNQGQVASSLLSKARQDKANKEAVSISSTKNIFYIIGIILSLAGTILIAGYFIAKYAPTPIAVKQAPIASLIPADTHQRIEMVTNQPAFMLAEKIRTAVSAPKIPGQINDIYYVAEQLRVSFPKVLAGLSISELPEGLLDQLTTKGTGPLFMHGTAQTDQGDGKFLVLPIKDYDVSFTLIKSWENSLLRDIGPFMGISENFLKTRLTRDIFKDEMISNKNVRVLRYQKPTPITLDEVSQVSEPESETIPVPTDDNSTPDTISPNFVSEGITAIASENPFVNTVSPYQENEIIMAYFFLNEHTLIIVDNVAIIPELLKRWANRQIYQ